MPDLPLGLLLTLAVEALIRLGLAIRIVMRRRPVAVSLAWLALLFFAPFVGAALYLLVGEVRLGRFRLRRHARAVEALRPYEAGLWRARTTDWPEEAAAYRNITRLATASTGLPPTAGNALRLVENAAFLDGLVADVEAAEHHVHLQFYIWMVGGAGDRLAEAVIAAARRGVACRVLVDDVGSRPFLRGPVARRMRVAGVEVVSALPASLLRLPFARLDLRNHRKIAVIDGRAAWTGSGNVTDDAFKVCRKGGIGPWIDAMVRVEGPAVRALQLTFLQDWMLDADRPLRIDETMLPEQVPASTAADGPGCVVQVLPSGPGDAPDAIHDAVLATIHSADRELVMTTPYFVPDESMLAAIRAAALGGVETHLVVPARLDAPLVALASGAALEHLMEVGVHVHRYEAGLLHSKTITVDGHLAIIGSVNFDMRSFWLNFETTLFVHDSDFASMLRWLQAGYMDASKRVDPVRFRGRSSARRFVEHAARLLGPVL